MNSLLVPLQFLKIMIVLYFSSLHVWILIFLNGPFLRRFLIAFRFLPSPSLPPSLSSICPSFYNFLLFLLSTEDIYYHKPSEISRLSILQTAAENPLSLWKCASRDFCISAPIWIAYFLDLQGITVPRLFLFFSSCISRVDPLFSINRSQIFFSSSFYLKKGAKRLTFRVCICLKTYFFCPHAWLIFWLTVTF